MASVSVVTDFECKLGEGALWVDRDNKFWFVDIKSHMIHSYCPIEKSVKSFTAPDQVGFIVPKRKGGFIAGLKTGLYDFCEETGNFEFIIDPEPQYPNNRLNDATIGPDGALYFGTMDDGESNPTGGFYRFDGELTKIEDGIKITNGPCFNPEGRVFYTVDTIGKIIYARDFCNTEFRNKRVFADLNDQEGYADGPVCDSKGNVWIGLFGGYGIRVYNPEGDLINFIKTPVSNVTKVSFGGENLNIAYVTTASVGLTDEQKKEQKIAGHVFKFKSEIIGNQTQYYTY